MLNTTVLYPVLNGLNRQILYFIRYIVIGYYIPFGTIAASEAALMWRRMAIGLYLRIQISC